MGSSVQLQASRPVRSETETTLLLVNGLSGKYFYIFLLRPRFWYLKCEEATY